MVSNKELLNQVLASQGELIKQNQALSKKQLEIALQFSVYQNKQELRFTKVESYLKSDSDTNTEGAIEKLNRIDLKITSLEKEILKKTTVFAVGASATLLALKWVISKIII